MNLSQNRLEIEVQRQGWGPWKADVSSSYSCITIGRQPASVRFWASARLTNRFGSFIS